MTPACSNCPTVTPTPYVLWTEFTWKWDPDGFYQQKRRGYVTGSTSKGLGPFTWPIDQAANYRTQAMEQEGLLPGWVT